MIDLYLIRHGQSEMNLSDRIGGQSNETPLTDTGKQQSLLLGKRLVNQNIHFDQIYSSSAKRALQTAQYAGQIAGFTKDDLTITSEILELSQGEWEGKKRGDMYTPETMAKINNDNWHFKAPGGESQKEVEERMLNWLDEEVESYYPINMKIGVFGHGLATKCLLRGVLDFSPKMTHKIRLNNTSITRLQYDERGWSVLSMNDNSHTQNTQYDSF